MTKVAAQQKKVSVKTPVEKKQNTSLESTPVPSPSSNIHPLKKESGHKESKATHHRVSPDAFSQMYVGDILKKERNQQGLELKTISESLRISVRYLEAIENKDINRLPEKVYTLGFIKSYAGYLNIPSDGLIEAFKADVYKDQEVSYTKNIKKNRSFKTDDSASTPSLKVILMTTALAGMITVAWVYFNGTDMVSSSNDTQAPSTTAVESQENGAEVVSESEATPSKPAVQKVAAISPDQEIMDLISKPSPKK